MLPSSKSALYPVIVAAFAATTATLGCAGAHVARVPATTMTTSATVVRAAQPHPQLLAAVRAEEDDVDDSPRGTLAFGDDVVRACRGLGDVKAPPGKEQMTWLFLMRSVARCVGDGDLGGRHIVLSGPSRPQVIVKFIFSKIGVAEEKIETTTARGQRSCSEDCDASDLRVDIGLATDAEPTTASNP